MIQRVSTSPVPVQLIDATDDPVITNGLVQMYGRFECPILVDFVHKIGLRGYQEAELDKLLGSFIVNPPASPDGAGAPASSEHSDSKPTVPPSEGVVS